MGLNAIETTRNIRKAYTEYLKSMFFFRNEKLKKVAVEMLDKEPLLKGPYIEMTSPFQTGKRIEQLIQEGVLSKEFAKLHKYFRLDMELYLHQEQAIRKIGEEKRNAVVATGTGSGKTECFMIPIINELMRQNEANQLGKGVRALLLYPMNALANDQIKRLREILADYPDITFGRYTGETKEKRKESEEEFASLNPGKKILENELICREEMRKSPPNILVTNYAMLEYLLLRPKDTEIFENGETWKYIVLDEAHTYFGAQGTEISMLLRRLKDRVVDGSKGKIQCIATSATLGNGREDYPEVAKFAEGLFSESFSSQDIIEATRLTYEKKQPATMLSYKDYQILIEYVNAQEGDMWKFEKLYEFTMEHLAGIEKRRGNWKEQLYQILKNDSVIRQLRDVLGEGPVAIQKVSSLIELPGDVREKQKFIMDMVDIAVMAKESEDELPLLPARYHTFVKSMEGAFVAFTQKPQVYFKHKKNVKNEGKNYKVFELGNCKKCGQEYLVGQVTGDGVLEQIQNVMDMETGEPIVKRYFMIGNIDEDLEYDEDEIEEAIGYKKQQYDLCINCGKLHPTTLVNKRACCGQGNSIRVSEIIPKNNRVTTICGNCAGYAKDIIKRFLTADDTSTEILARELYQNIPNPVERKDEDSEETDDWGWGKSSKNDYDKSKRKLLVFSDSRSEAAYFATFMDYRYINHIWRKIGLEALKKIEVDEEVSIDTWVRYMAKIAEENNICEEESTFTDIKSVAYLYAMKEVVALEDIGLQGTGSLGFYLPQPEWWRVPSKICSILDATVDEVWTIFANLLDSFRGASVISFPDDVNPEDEEFVPRNFKVYFKQVKGKDEKNIVGWLPSNGTENKRLDYIKKILIKNNMRPTEAKKNAYDILEQFTKTFDKFKKEGYFVETNLGTKGIGGSVNYKKFRILIPYNNQAIYRCNKCGRMTTYNVKGVCPAFRCEGELESYKGEETRLSYYKSLYEQIKLIPLKIEEHTAQLSNARAAELQNKFEKSQVNILSCSTTFEMGVDVGQLEAVFMRNIPPETANYVQRAGRAGRRTESTAYSLTFAKRRSHDMNYFNHPEQIISGKIKPPYIEENNIKIVRRHLHSVVFAWFFKQYEEYFDTVEDLIRYGIPQESVDIVLKELLEQKPAKLFKSLQNVMPEALKQELGIEEWKWVGDLLDKESYLACAKSQYIATIEELTQIIKERINKNLMVDSYRRTINTYQQKTALDFLARNSIIPRYGFPIDSVDLDIRYHGQEASQVELSRDLKMAISEFAPNSEIIAGGKVWTSYRINKNPQKNWPTFYYAQCKQCHRTYKFHSDLNQTRDELFESTIANNVCSCGEKLQYIKYIQPIFGFATSHEKPKKPLGRKSEKFYSTEVFFDNYQDNPEGDIVPISHQVIAYKYSSKGTMFLVNRGGSNGFKICSSCGYATTSSQDKDHYIGRGNKCKNKYLHNVALGHEFMTDVLEIHLPWIPVGSSADKIAISTIYGILEGASRELGISKREINGCLSYTEGRWPSFVLYDEVPGGAGHVKHIAKHLEQVLQGALKSVSGECGCDEDTSCYGCIRNYSNQFHHEKLERGSAKVYLEALLRN